MMGISMFGRIDRLVPIAAVIAVLAYGAWTWFQASTLPTGVTEKADRAVARYLASAAEGEPDPRIEPTGEALSPTGVYHAMGKDRFVTVSGLSSRLCADILTREHPNLEVTSVNGATVRTADACEGDGAVLSRRSFQTRKATYSNAVTFRLMVPSGRSR